MMTNYIFGDPNSQIAKVDLDENSFRPSFQHVFNETFPPSYIRIKCVIKGKEQYRIFDLSSQQFVKDANLDVNNNIILDTQQMTEHRV